MQKFTFTNSKGSVEIGKFKNYIFDSYDFGGETSYQREEYSETDGDVILSALYEPRTISINGHIMASNQAERFARRRELYRVLDGKTEGTLTYKNDNGEWTIKCIPRLPTIGSTKGPNIAQFALYFEAPAFYWEGEAHKWSLYSRCTINIFPLTFPLVTTYRQNYTVLDYNGSLEAPPTIIIACNRQDLDDVTAMGADDVANITITVEHGGESTSLRLDYTPDKESSEVITIDCDAMTIVSNVNGSLIKYLTIDSDFPVFKTGRNKITFYNNTAQKNIYAIVKWKEREVGI